MFIYQKEKVYGPNYFVCNSSAKYSSLSSSGTRHTFKVMFIFIETRIYLVMNNQYKTESLRNWLHYFVQLAEGRSIVLAFSNCTYPAINNKCSISFSLAFVSIKL
jgi:hypothetical protein